MIHCWARSHYGTNVGVFMPGKVLSDYNTVSKDPHLSKCPAHEFIDVRLLLSFQNMKVLVCYEFVYLKVTIVTPASPSPNSPRRKLSTYFWRFR